MDLVIVALGALALFAVGPFVGRTLDSRLGWSHVHAPSGVDNTKWRDAVVGLGPGAPFLGRLESLLVYLAVVYATDSAGLIVAGWLAFKVASKWEMWTNVVKMPTEFEDTTPLDSLRARRTLGYVLYDRFLFGTLVNILSGAIIGGLILRFGLPLLNS